jgi:hypothetical protein
LKPIDEIEIDCFNAADVADHCEHCRCMPMILKVNDLETKIQEQEKKLAKNKERWEKRLK